MWYLAWVIGVAGAIFFSVRSAVALEKADEKKGKS